MWSVEVRLIEEKGRCGIEVTIRSAPADEGARRLVERLRALRGRLVGYPEGGSITRRVVPLNEVLLIETSERKAWIILVSGERLESPMRLFELEAALEGTEFVRASRQALVNFDHVRGIRPEPNGKLDLEVGGRHVPVSRGYFLLSYVVGIPALLLGRWIGRRLLFALHRHRRVRRSVVVAGDAAHVADIIRVFKRERWLGYDVVGVLTPNVMACPQFPGIPAVGAPENALDVARTTDVSTIVFAEGSFPRSHMFNRLAAKLEAEKVELIVVPALSDIAAQRMTMRPVAGMPLMYIDKPSTHSYNQITKRAFDIVCSSLLILVSLPVIGITALAIKREDGGPILFKQQRIGIGGRPFECYKVRSMVTNAAEIKKQLIAQNQNESDGDVLFKMKEDPRITKVGRFIRRFSIDELPQFFNVFKGDMSLVGPRPALKSEVDKYEQHVRRRLDVRPGITGLWQVSGRSDLSWEDTVRLDLYYVDNWSLIQDFSILVKTFKAVFSSSGAY